MVFFYPKALTKGCTTEAQDFRDRKDAFAAANTAIVGISRDPVEQLDKFVAKETLNFALASDAQGSVCEAYGVWVEKSMYGKKYMGIERSTCLIDATGTVREVWRKVKVKDHAQKVLEAARAL